MIEENPVTYGSFGETADKNPENEVVYGEAETSSPTDWGTDPSHTQTAHPTKGNNFSSFGGSLALPGKKGKG